MRDNGPATTNEYELPEGTFIVTGITINVALDVPLPKLFDYRLEPEGAGNPVGQIVKVSFGSGEKIGVVLGVTDTSEQPEDKLKTEIGRAHV